MKAAVLYQYNTPLSVEEVEYRGPQQGQVLVRMVGSGVCHTDLAIIEDQLFAPFPLPIILGHEGAGIVEEAGPGVTAVKASDHVILSWVPNCGVCRYCTIGRPALCVGMMRGTVATHFSKGEQNIFNFGPTSFSEYSIVPESACIKIREDAPLEKVCLIGCGVMTGAGAAMFTAKVAPGSSVAIIGCGGVGLNTIQGAALCGAEKIIAVDILDNKLEFARTFGATHTVNAKNHDPVEAVKELTGGQGVEYSFEVIGAAQTIRQAYDMLAAGGTCVVVGAAPRGTEVSLPTQSFFDEKGIIGSRYGSARMRVDIPRLVDLYMDKKIKLDELITQSLPLTEINKAFDDLKAGKVARSVIKYS
ncbi:MAG TPA: Zn-dependent alcohol dehydrogenase [Dehalococcoidia bacterium]|nr:Zn-dependent alcohol dehydrogenase [Dehalococcoidia bacterium]